ncbi:hypothetical protein MLC59_02570 [Marinobacter bryozoorum]|uniref:hypothetical protein n=1 Tax=Marinobacter bryozoorum TaxID=256324 RepID=UPI002002FD30|nr:hypothetical protein [Marinobacter bryozoorum]MCK7543052.1 hypothetical protein [Marinobacter bryozoorum]
MAINNSSVRDQYSNQQRYLGNATRPLSEEPVWFAIVAHKGRQVAELVGKEPAELEARAHRYAASMGLKRAVVSVRPA